MRTNPREGDAYGRDRLRSSPVEHDPFAASAPGEVTAPTVVVLGLPGGGQAAAMETRTVIHPAPDRSGRRVIVLASMPPPGVGEYEALVRALEEGASS